jgi:hypothetical protein
VFGSEVEITEINGKEISFTVKKTGEHGSVCAPELFAENTPKNLNKVRTVNENIDKLITMTNEASNMERETMKIVDSIERAKLPSN